jgi:putative PEP-CTERM system TPR-repeat lipoprotein
MKPVFTPSRLLAALLTGALLSGCGGDSPEALVQQGMTQIGKGDTRAAEISFKSALQEDENNATARLELGKLYLERRDFASAEKELRRARAAGTDKTLLDPLLARALIGMREYQRVLDELPVPDGNAPQAIPLLLARADSQMGLGEVQDAKATIERAQAIAPDNADVYVALARAALADKQVDVASRNVDAALERNPKHVDAWLLKGDLLRFGGKNAEAADAYRSALSHDDTRHEARIALANIAIAEQRLDDAIVELDRVLKVERNNLFALVSRAQIDVFQKKFTAARDRLAPVMKAAPNYLPALLLDGTVQYALNNMTSAETSLKKYVAAEPRNLYARRLLAASILRQQRAQEADKVLAGIDIFKIPDAGIHVVAGEIARALKDNARAEQHFAFAAKLNPDSAGIRTELGLIRLAEGDQRALGDLQAAAGLDESDARPDRLIVLKLLKDGQYADALKAIANIEKKTPNDPQVYNYRAAAQLGLGKLGDARKSFETALKIQPGFYPAAANLAQLDLKDKNYAAAQKRFDGVLKAAPTDLRALMAVAQLRLLQKDPQGFVKYANDAAKAHPKALEPRLALARHYLEQKKIEPAIAAARAAVDASPASPDALELLGSVQLAARDYPSAISTLRKMVDLSPQKTQALGKLATAQLAAREPGGARETLKELLRGDPDSTAALGMMAGLEISNGSPSAGLKIAQDLQKRLPGDPIGYRLAGDAHRALKQAPEALAAYERAHKIKPESVTLIGQHISLLALGRAEEGEKRLVAWLANHKNDHSVRALHAERLLERKQYRAAADQYIALDRALPGNPLFLNNLAWALYEARDPRAVDFAARAQKVAPESAPILDTYGWILTHTGKASAALPHLKKATQLAPDSSEIRWHLAYALNASGDRNAARSELDKLLKQGDFPQQAEARALRQQLGQ